MLKNYLKKALVISLLGIGVITAGVLSRNNEAEAEVIVKQDSDTNKPHMAADVLPCNTIEHVINLLEKDFGEKLIFASTIDEIERTQMAMFYNPYKKSYTVIQVRIVKDEHGERQVACMLDSGTIERLTLDAFTGWKS
jgi:hypothetical protein